MKGLLRLYTLREPPPDISPSYLREEAQTEFPLGLGLPADSLRCLSELRVRGYRQTMNGEGQHYIGPAAEN